jgi:hypothetical protein
MTTMIASQPPAIVAIISMVDQLAITPTFW